MTKKLYKSSTPYVVRGGGGVIAESKNAVIMAQEGQRDRVFFPKSDVAMILFDPSETSAKDAKLGEVSYYHLAGKSLPLNDVAWTYEDADGEFSELAEFLTFDENRVTVEAL